MDRTHGRSGPHECEWSGAQACGAHAPMEQFPRGGGPPSNPRALACLESRESELAFLFGSLIKRSPPPPPPGVDRAYACKKKKFFSAVDRALCHRGLFFAESTPNLRGGREGGRYLQKSRLLKRSPRRCRAQRPLSSGRTVSPLAKEYCRSLARFCSGTHYSGSQRLLQSTIRSCPCVGPPVPRWLRRRFNQRS